MFALPDYLQTFFLQSLSAVITGAVAGYIAGLVLIRKQLRLQSEMDDSGKLIRLRNKFEEERDALQGLIGFEEYMTKQPDYNKEQSEERIQDKNGDLIQMLFELPSQLGHIQSQRYRTFKTYLLLRLRRTDLLSVPGLDETIRIFDGLINDFNEVLRRPRGIVRRLKHYWRRAKGIPSTLVKRLNYRERELLVQAGKEFSHLSLIGETHQFVSSLDRSYGIFNDKRAKQYVKALRGLESKGLIKLKKGNDYYLSESGWKRLAEFQNDLFD